MITMASGSIESAKARSDGKLRKNNQDQQIMQNIQLFLLNFPCIPIKDRQGNVDKLKNSLGWE